MANKNPMHDASGINNRRYAFGGTRDSGVYITLSSFISAGAIERV
jgi:hypothetical protein